MKASILINTYNYAQFLPEAIESGLSQTETIHEIIVVDDGSTDETEAEIRPRYETDSRIKWIRQTNGGQLSAFQAGVEAATGDVCFFLDADDYFEDDYIQLMLEYYRAHPRADFVFSEPCKFDSPRANPPSIQAPKSYDYGISVVRELASQRFIGRPTSALSAKTSLLRRLFPFPSEVLTEWKVSADECLVHGASLCGANKHFYGIQRVNYRIHGQNLYQSTEKHKIDIYHKRLRILSFIEFLKAREHIGDLHCSRAREEFLTLPKPSQKDRFLYKCIEHNYGRRSKLDRKTLYLKLLQKLNRL
jgi:glycosyltransferase involved in cell wall biosynthesis